MLVASPVAVTGQIDTSSLCNISWTKTTTDRFIIVILIAILVIIIIFNTKKTTYSVLGNAMHNDVSLSLNNQRLPIVDSFNI